MLCSKIVWVPTRQLLVSKRLLLLKDLKHKSYQFIDSKKDIKNGCFSKQPFFYVLKWGFYNLAFIALVSASKPGLSSNANIFFL
jgi:hypothetical protein